jgi:hypothetical protein
MYNIRNMEGAPFNNLRVASTVPDVTNIETEFNLK